MRVKYEVGQWLAGKFLGNWLPYKRHRVVGMYLDGEQMFIENYDKSGKCTGTERIGIDDESVKPWLDGEHVYYRVYQDRESMDGGFYVATVEEVVRNLPHWMVEDGLPPVLEPVTMSVEEFEALPEFQGF